MWKNGAAKKLSDSITGTSLGRSASVLSISEGSVVVTIAPAQFPATSGQVFATKIE